MNTIFLMVASFLISTNAVFAHGENKPGPHGGHIRMTGNIHTELLLSEQSIKIYVLDIAFASLPIDGIEIEVQMSTGDKMKKVACEKKLDLFECLLPTDHKSFSSITVSTSRINVKMREVKYPFPLVPFAKKNGSGK